MNPASEIETQPEPDHIARAGDLLEAILTRDLTTSERLAVGAALSVLYDVRPPYPLRPAPIIDVDLATGVDDVLAVLSEADGATASVEEATRVGRAARELHRIRDRR